MHEPSVADRLAIRELVDAYTNAVNFKQWDVLGSLFAEDGVWCVKGAHTDREVVGRAAVVAEISTVVEKFEILFQTTSALRVHLAGESATATSANQEYIKVETEPDITLFGFYFDTFKKTPEGWQFARRDYRGRYYSREALPGSVMPLVEPPAGAL